MKLVVVKVTKRIQSEHVYNDIRLYDTTSIASDVMWPPLLKTALYFSVLTTQKYPLLDVTKFDSTHFGRLYSNDFFKLTSFLFIVFHFYHICFF
jgi:hypothetical protein